MSLMDEVLCDHELFADHRGEAYQTDSLNAVFPGAKFEITASGRLELLVCEYEDHSDPNAVGFASLFGPYLRVSGATSTSMAGSNLAALDARSLPTELWWRLCSSPRCKECFDWVKT